PDIAANPMTGAIVAREAVEKFGDLKKWEATVGTGPWMLDGYRPNIGMTLLRNPHYFVPGLPYIDRVQLVVRNNMKVNDPPLTDMLLRQRRVQDPAKRRELLLDIQRYLAPRWSIAPRPTRRSCPQHGIQPSRTTRRTSATTTAAA